MMPITHYHSKVGQTPAAGPDSDTPSSSYEAEHVTSSCRKTSKGTYYLPLTAPLQQGLQ